MKTFLTGTRSTNMREQAIFATTDVLTIRTGVSRWYNDTEATLTILKVRIQVLNAGPTGAAILVDLNKNGTTLYSTQGNRPTIAAAAGAGATNLATLPNTLTMAVGDYLSVDIDQVGSTIAGTGLVITVTLV